MTSDETNKEPTKYKDLDSHQDWVKYCDRKEWSDIKPLEQDDGPHNVVRIAYEEDFEDVYNYFRAIVEAGELSERALLLTEDAITMNAANYSVWQYRRKIIQHLKLDLKEELEFSQSMIESNPKNYQVWHHRRVIVEMAEKPDGEKELTDSIFDVDSKNYHAWEHRQWVLKTFKNYEGELEFVEKLLKQDLRNNSAWNQRFFVVARTTGFTEQVILSEIEYTKNAIEKIINNESPWTYLLALVQQSEKRLSDWKELEDWCLELYSKNKNPFLAGFLIEIAEDHLDKGSDNKEDRLKFVNELCDDLSKNDKLRHNYWNYISSNIKRKYSS